MGDAESQTFEYSARAASDSLYDLSSQLRKVEKLSGRGNVSVLATGLAQLGTQTAETTKIVHRATEWNVEDLQPHESKHRADLAGEFEKLLRRVRDLQTSVTDALRKQQQRQAANESTPLLHSNGQQQQQLQQPGQQQVQQQVLEEFDRAEVDLHSALIECRDAEIAEIQRGVREINAIFQDLGVLVTEQGEALDTVEDNIANLARQTQNAGHQLVKAENYQRSRGKWTCIALLVLLFITIIVAISVLGPN